MRPLVRPNTRWLVAAVAATGLVLAGTATVPVAAERGEAQREDLARKAGPAQQVSAKLRRAVKPAGIMEHLQAFDRIAVENDGNRAAGTSGYTESRDYVVRKLREAGYKPRVERVDFVLFEEHSPSTLEQLAPDATTYDNPDDFITMDYSAAGDVTGDIAVVDTDLTPTDSSTSGCQSEDFTDFTAGDVALMQRGSCDFAVKVANAADAGAAAAIIFNRGTENNTAAVAGTLGGPADIPALGASFALGEDLATPEGTSVHLTTDTESTPGTTHNVIAETKRGDDSNVVMAGAHLDSVTEGAGVNDNGSGSATILEVAEQFAAKNIKPKQAVRFAWWGAEELGLFGSQYYIDDLWENNPSALEDIRLYLNFDMVGSPNFVRFAYDGDNSTFPVGPGVEEGPEGSGQIERLFRKYFRSQDLASAPTPFNGRSDYGPFIAIGIPAGGLFTGAEGVKTEEQAELFGGTAGEPYDACYHQACDTLGNVNRTAINQMSDAVAHAVGTYATSLDSLGSTPSRASETKRPPARKAGHHGAADAGSSRVLRR